MGVVAGLKTCKSFTLHWLRLPSPPLTVALQLQEAKQYYGLGSTVLAASPSGYFPPCHRVGAFGFRDSRENRSSLMGTSIISVSEILKKAILRCATIPLFSQLELGHMQLGQQKM